jgi:hypothetical protein
MRRAVVSSLLVATVLAGCSGGNREEPDMASPDKDKDMAMAMMMSGNDLSMMMGGDGGSGSPIVINELLADPDVALGQMTDYAELFNPTNSDIDLTGFKLIDDDVTHVPYVLPPGSIVPMKGFLTVNFGDPSGTSFGLGKNGDTCTLLSPTDAVVDTVTFVGADAPLGKTYGRLPDGSSTFVKGLTATKGTPNML